VQYAAVLGRAAPPAPVSFTDWLFGRKEKAPAPAESRPAAPESTGHGAAPAESTADKVGDFLNSRQGKKLQKDVMRGVFGMLKKRL